MKKITFLLLNLCLFLFLNSWAQNVGIGTTNPLRPLHIQHASAAYAQFTNNTTGSTANDGSFIGAFQDDLYIWNEEGGGNQFFYTNNLRRMTIDSVGRVGIGKWPEEELDVKGSLRVESTTSTGGASIKMYGGTSSLSYIQFYKDINTPTSMGYLGFSPTGEYATIQRGSSVTVNSAGVGIGTIDPDARLHVPFGVDAGLPNTSNGFLMLGQTTTLNTVFDNNEIQARNNSVGSDLFMQHSAGNLLLCGNEQGAVGIGITSGAFMPAGYLLAVDGKIISEEIKVQLSGNWPDYVFQDNYQLKSFDHLRSYIKENKHLPNIPPAAEVEKNGIEVGDMQKRMMEKIEELTLYILDLEQRLKTLETSSAQKQNSK